MSEQSDDARGLLREAKGVIESLDAIISGEISREWADYFGKDWEDMTACLSRITAHLAAPAPDKSELELIHEICLNVADCPPIAESDTRTVRYVKDMAHLINRLSAPAPEPVATVRVGPHDHGPFIFRETAYGADHLADGEHKLYALPLPKEQK